MPTRDSGCDRDRVGQGVGGAREPDRRDEEESEQHCRGEAVDPSHRRAPGNAVGQDDVGGEQRSVRERERDADRLALEAHVGEQVDADGRRRDRGDVATPCARRAAASAIGPMNSIAATVASGSRSIEM